MKTNTMIDPILRLFAVVFSGLFIVAGCSLLKPISYAFAEDEADSASISFRRANPGVSFVSYKNSILPDAEKGTIWDPILFPYGVPLEITVHAFYYDSNTGVTYGDGLLTMIITDAASSGIREARSVDTDVIFSCPPLAAGKKYTLSFDKGYGMPGKNKLILTNNETKEIVYLQEFHAIEYPQPEFNKPFVTVIDASKTDGQFEDNVKLYNKSADSNIRFNIYAHDPKTNEWILYGAGSLKGAGDTETVNSKIRDISKYRYFAVESLNGKDYTYQFYESRDDLHIIVFDYQQ
jgi:hypothetical protein